MQRKRIVILVMLAVASLSCSTLTHKVEAEEQTGMSWTTGTVTSECILLQRENPPISIKVQRSGVDFCADTVWEHKDVFCNGTGTIIEIEKDPRKTDPRFAVGNQRCPETILVFKRSDPCFEYHSGCRKRYIPRG